MLLTRILPPRSLLFSAIALAGSLSVSAMAETPVFVNEIHYDNASTDVDEAIEIAGPVGTDLLGWQLILYNGATGLVYQSLDLDGILADDGSGLGFYSVYINGLQNGSPDGLALINSAGEVVQFLSYEGVLEALDGPASGMTSTDIGVSESTSSPVGFSLQLSGTGLVAEDFVWSAASGATFGVINTAQTVGEGSGGQPLSSILINELDSDTDGTDTREFIELFDGGLGHQDLSGFTLVFYNGSSDTVYTVISLDGYFTDDQGYFVVGNSDVAEAVITFADNGLQNGADAVALYQAPSDQFSPGDAVTTDNLVDAVVYDTDDSDDAGLLVLLNAGQPQVNENMAGNKTAVSIQRCSNGAGGQRNTVSFAAWTPTPAAANSCEQPAIAVRIHEIQGSTDESPLAGAKVIVDGVVTADMQGSDSLNGFFIQEQLADQDADPTTSEGIFVYAPTASDVTVGDRVQVQGTVVEFNGLTEISSVDSVVPIGSGYAIAPVQLLLPVAEVTDLEALEGMLVTVSQPLYVTEHYNLARYGEILLAAEQRLPIPTLVATPGEEAVAQQLENSRYRLLVDDASTQQNPDPVVYPGPALAADNTLRGGDSVTGLTGVISYGFSEYRLQPTEPPVFVSENPRTAEPSLGIDAELTVASFNVLNFFNGDGLGGGFPTSRGANTAEEFERQQAKIIAAIVAMDADVLGLIEIENDGYGEHSAIADLVERVNLQSASEYAFVNPGVAQIGTDEITVGYIYNVDTVEPVGAVAVLDSSNSLVDTVTGEPLFLDSKNRPALAQTFREKSTAARFTLAMNHLKSKGSDCNDLGDSDLLDGQGNCNLTRTRAAQAEVHWLDQNPTDTVDQDILVMGDMNAYAMEDPIQTFIASGFADLLQALPLATRYSYVFNGEWGYLDHALANNALQDQVTDVSVWHINADEPRALDYNTEFKSEGQVTSFYAADAYRSSDHDPVLVGLNLTTNLTDISDYVDDLIAREALMGNAPHADKSLQRFLRLITQAQRVEQIAHSPKGHHPSRASCAIMHQVLVRADGKMAPWDWVVGEGVSSVTRVVNNWMDDHCENRRGGHKPHH